MYTPEKEPIKAPGYASKQEKRYEVLTINAITSTRVALTDSLHFAMFIYGEYQHDSTPVAVYDHGELQVAANVVNSKNSLVVSPESQYDAVKDRRLLNILKHQIRAVYDVVVQLKTKYPASQERREVQHEISVLLDEMKIRNLLPQQPKSEKTS